MCRTQDPIWINLKCELTKKLNVESNSKWSLRFTLRMESVITSVILIGPPSFFVYVVVFRYLIINFGAS